MYSASIACFSEVSVNSFVYARFMYILVLFCCGAALACALTMFEIVRMADGLESFIETDWWTRCISVVKAVKG